MSFVEIRDNVIWAKHIHENDALKQKILNMPAANIIELKVGDTIGHWKKMENSPIGVPTPGLKPIGSAKNYWKTLQKNRGKLVHIEEKKECSSKTLLSKIPLSIQLHTNTDISNTSTGFFFNYNKLLYLVTSNSILLGLNSKKIADIKLVCKNRELDLEIPTFLNKQPNWLEHPQYSTKVDLIAFIIDKMPKNVQIHTINAPSLTSKFNIKTAQDIFVLGYPTEFSNNDVLIWKKATIASDPNIDLELLPKYLINIAPQKGMHGSPVISCPDNFDKNNKKPSINFVGIYTSQHSNSIFGSYLGVTWKPRIIQEIISGKQIGSIK